MQKITSIKDLPSSAGALFLGLRLEDIYINTLSDGNVRIILKIENGNLFCIDTHSSSVETSALFRQNSNLNN